MRLNAVQRLQAAESADTIQKQIVIEIIEKLAPGSKILKVGDASYIPNFRAKPMALRQVLKTVATSFRLDMNAKLSHGKSYLGFTLYDENEDRLAWVTYDTLYGMLYVQV